MNEPKQGNYNGWAILEIFGHQRYAGYVTTEAFGSSVLLRCDIPELKERDILTKSGRYVFLPDDGSGSRTRVFAPPGSTIKQDKVDAYTKYFGVSAIYAMTPCTEEACLRLVEEIQPREPSLVSLPPEKALPAASEVDPYICCSGNSHIGHSIHCHQFEEPADEPVFQEGLE